MSGPRANIRVAAESDAAQILAIYAPNVSDAFVSFELEVPLKVGVRSYAMANIDFPHQSTANQWFTESQFESNRSLGFEIMEDLLYRASKDEQHAAQPNLRNLLGSLRNATVASTGNAERAPPRQARPLRPERETQPT